MYWQLFPLFPESLEHSVFESVKVVFQGHDETVFSEAENRTVALNLELAYRTKNDPLGNLGPML